MWDHGGRGAEQEYPQAANKQGVIVIIDGVEGLRGDGRDAVVDPLGEGEVQCGRGSGCSPLLRC
jgi:hypothetical protein